MVFTLSPFHMIIQKKEILWFLRTQRAIPKERNLIEFLHSHVDNLILSFDHDKNKPNPEYKPKVKYILNRLQEYQ